MDILKQLDMTAEEYTEWIKLPDTPLDLLSVFMFARLYRIHISVIIFDTVWSTSKVNDVQKSKFILIYRGFNNFAETCCTNCAELYLDSLILNTQQGKMPCHQVVSKLDPEEEEQAGQPAQPIDLSAGQNSATSGSIKSELQKEADKVSSVSIIHVHKPKNKRKTSQYSTALKLLLKAKVEIQHKEEKCDTADRISSHIKSNPINPQEIAQCAKQRRHDNKMIQTICEFCSTLCRSRREYVHHRMEYHPLEKYICKYCQKEYKSANGCYKHECTHTTPLSVCGVCGRIFQLPNELCDHLPVHNAASKVSCPGLWQTICN